MTQHGHQTLLMEKMAEVGFAFDCYENAVAFGGHHVANAWVAVRAAIMDAGDLIPAAAQVIQPGSSVDVAPKAVAKKPSKLRLRTGPDQPEQLELRISVLSGLFSKLVCYILGVTYHQRGSSIGSEPVGISPKLR